MRHKRDERDLPQIGTLARHIRSRDDHRAVVAVVETAVVRNETVFRDRLNDGVPPLLDLQRAALRDFGAAVLVFFGDRGEGNEAVEQRDRPRNPLKNGNIARKHFHKLAEQMLFEPGSSVRTAENLPFQIFEFLRRIAHAVCERLSGNVGIGNFILKGVGHFNVIAEHAVKPDFQVADPRALPLARFKL